MSLERGINYQDGEIMNRKALICGISGQDGAWLTKFLLKKGYAVVGTSRDAQMSSFLNLKTLGIYDKVRTESMTLTDFRSVFQVLRTAMPDEIYNLAGQSSVGLSFNQPVETLESIALGTLNLLEAIRILNIPVRIYNAASSECFGDTKGEKADENTPFHPRSPYAVAKSAAFWEVANYREAYGLFACSGILFNHESPLRPERFVTRKIVCSACRVAKGSQEILELGNLDIQRDWGWAPEYVDGIWRVLQQPTAEDFVFATGVTRSLKDFVSLAFRELNLDWRDHVRENPNLLRASEIMYSGGNASKADKLLGWRAKVLIGDVVKKMILSEMEGIRSQDD